MPAEARLILFGIEIEEDMMSESQAEFYCVDCKACKAGGKRSLLGRSVKSAATMGLSSLSRAADRSSCGFCGHKEYDHKDKIESPSFAFTPKGGEFDFEPDDAIGFRSITCIQSASTSVGSGFSPSAGDSYNLAFLHDGVEVSEVKGGERLTHVPYETVYSLEVGGPGVQTSGGGWGGGGFGLAGFAVGVAAAGILNKVTTKTTVQTLLRITVASSANSVAEWVFLTAIDTPEAIDSVLRPVTLQLEHRHRMDSGAGHEGAGQDKITKLKELAQMRADGLITQDEFDQLKADLMS